MCLFIVIITCSISFSDLKKKCTCQYWFWIVFVQTADPTEMRLARHMFLKWTCWQTEDRFTFSCKIVFCYIKSGTVVSLEGHRGQQKEARLLKGKSVLTLVMTLSGVQRLHWRRRGIEIVKRPIMVICHLVFYEHFHFSNCWKGFISCNHRADEFYSFYGPWMVR